MRLRKRAFRVYARVRRSLLGIPQPGSVDFGDLRRVEPIGRHFGLDRPVSGDVAPGAPKRLRGPTRSKARPPG